MSTQLDTYLAARASGVPVDEACEQSGIGPGEAELWEADIASGEVDLPRAPAPAHTRGDQSNEEGTMDDQTTTTMRIGGGPEMPLNLDNLEDPMNDTAKAAISDTLARHSGPSVASDQLRLFIERIERLTEERKGIADDIADVYGEAKAMGYDKPTIRRIVRLRAMDSHARQEAAALLETYANAVGLQDALPL